MAGVTFGIQEALNSGHISGPSLRLGWLAQGLECGALRPISKSQPLKESFSLASKGTLAPSP